MKVILTHEQADFDAVGALLGASLIFKDSIPIAPRRMNRNLRAFINLYGSELPFLDARDLSFSSIKAVILVDTQALVTLKGMNSNTPVEIFDHHQQRTDLPKNWKINLDRTGSATTIFVEMIKEHKISFNHFFATLMLIGIYEDTGSLTYVGTTPRDIYAAAYLLENGASLHIASQYLNPPLSPDQIVVFDRLLANCETLSIQGQNIIISRAPANDLTEEISSIAHKMRDLLEPDALFLLVSIPEGVRLVARATTDLIDVAAIAAQFGGGGHPRAAAALLHANLFPVEDDLSLLDQAYQRLANLLPSFVSPPITVKQIMSRGPLVLTPETKVEQANQLMQRYGYEGYPIVKDQKVIGLLTRRAVDRAMSHNLKITAGSLMEAGEVVVHQHDSLEHLQRIMTSSGWGQIPVVTDDNTKIIGIVTRTDLIKTLSGSEVSLPGQKNLAIQLEEKLPPTRTALIKAIAEVAHAHRLAIYIVGGFVRDLILNLPCLDFDIVVEGDAIALGRILANQYGGRVVVHHRFGTAKWWIADIREELAKNLSNGHEILTDDLPESLDLISARTEFYDYPTALPTVERSSIKLDLHRRDFTFNTMALRLDGRHYGELYDFWGGLVDLERGLVRVLHSLSFVDDPTRILRAVRFEQRFGFQIEARTLELINEAHPLLKQVSGDRLRHELNLIIAESQPEKMFARLQSLNLLSAIHQDLYWDTDLTEPLHAALKFPIDPIWNFHQNTNSSSVRRNLAYLIWLGRLSIDVIQQINKRIHFPSQLLSSLHAASELWQDLSTLPQMPTSQIVRRLDKVPAEALYAIDRLNSDAATHTLIRKYLYEWKHIHPITNGNTLAKLGLKPGPVYSEILESLRNAWLDGKIGTKEDEKACLDDIFQTKNL